MAEDTDLKPVQLEFESPVAHHPERVEGPEVRALERGINTSRVNGRGVVPTRDDPFYTCRYPVNSLS
jgi:hypothetical protein